MKNSVPFTVITLLLTGSSLPAATHFVSLGSTNPTPPYTSWVTAATNIQPAVDVAVAGDEVVVSDGIYATDRALSYSLADRVAVTKPLTVRSVNGPQATIIVGYQDQAGFYPMTRCVYLTNGASLSGFTLTNGGAYLKSSDIPDRSKAGGGVFCESSGCIVSNCVIKGNVAFSGGGARNGTLNHCTLSGNWGGDGGGAQNSTLNNCYLIGNSAAGMGGGASDCTLNNCVLTSNSASGTSVSGGGAAKCSLYNCTVIGNSTPGYGGGVIDCTCLNCIVYSNTAAQAANYYLEDSSESLNYCCTAPLPAGGTGNLTNAPLFVDYAQGNLRLQSGSPCINAGNNAYASGANDLDGRPRIVGGTVDMGAYEFQPGVSGAFLGWLQQYGLPTDGSADYTDPDHDGLNNWQEWVCGTNPTNALSVLRMVAALPTGTNVIVTWQSVAGMNYFLERSGNLASPFTLLATNILGQAGGTSYADTSAKGAGPVFYRVGVRVW